MAITRPVLSKEDQAVLDDLYEALEDETRMVQSTRELLTSLAARRRSTVAELRSRGQSHKQIADRIGVSKSAIQQILS